MVQRTGAPELLGVPSGATLAQYTQGFQQQERSSEHNKHQNPWRLGDPTGGAYTAPQARIAGPAQSPTPAVSTSGFQLQNLGLKQLREPKLLLNQGPSEPCYTSVCRDFWIALSAAGGILSRYLVVFVGSFNCVPPVAIHSSVRSHGSSATANLATGTFTFLVCL